MAKIYKSPLPDIEIPEVSFTDFLLKNCDKYADKLALVDGSTDGRKYTYAQVKALTTQLAQGLAEQELVKGDVVCIFCPNLPEWPIMFMGASLAGATLTTVNPLYTVEELGKQLSDSNARFLFTVPPMLETAKKAAENVGLDAKKIFVLGGAEGFVSFKELVHNDGKSAPKVTINPKEDTLVIPYSSGTTGLPKGVMLTHYNIVANLCQVNAVEKDNFSEDSRFLGLLPFFHVYGLVIIFCLGIQNGLTIVTMTRFELERFLTLVQDHKLTHLHLVPPIVLALAKHPIIDKYDISSTKSVISGAAPLGKDLEDAVKKRLNINIKQGYGMTEMSPVSHIAPNSKIKSGTVGVLVPNGEARIVDPETGKDAELGELLYRGPNVMKGYLGNEEATKNTFTDDGWLKTGDIAKVDKEGYFSIVDRLKELIKYKGFQCPPAELEDVLLTHAEIEDACVIGVPDEEAGELPRAYVKKKKDSTLDEKTVQEWFSTKVAPFKKLRGGVRFVDAIPKSASGKILRRMLKEQVKAEQAKK